MTEAPPEPESETQDPQEPMLRTLAIVMLILPVLGLIAHGIMYVLAGNSAEFQEWVRAYVRGPAMKVVAAIAFINLVGNFFHYRRTRMNLDIAARVLTYVWILSIVLMLRAAYWAAAR